MSLMAFVKFGYALVVVTLLLMIWASLSRAIDLHVDTGHPPCLFQALCTCSKPAGDLGIVTCNHVPILKVPPTVNSSKVFMLQLTGNKIRDLDPHFFQATGLYRLAINQNPLENIHEEAFHGLDNTLWELELRQDKLTIVPSRALRYLQKLRLLDLTGNEIADITAENWRGLENTLQTLILADNSLVNLPLDAFSSLPMLETLDLSGNHLTVIDSGVFRDGMGRLSKLILADNQLAMIPYEQVSPLRQLRHLDLSSNVIKQVPPTHDINGVRLSLDTLKLDNNLIGMLIPGSFKLFNVLNYTSLNGNPIYFIREDAFRNAKIKTLSLKNCDITDLSPSAFAGLENSLQSLDLSENNLTSVTFKLNQLDALRVLDLRENRVDINLIATNMQNYFVSSNYNNNPSNYNNNPSNYNNNPPNYNNFQFKLFSLDISGANSYEMSLQDLRRMRSLRSLSVGKLLRRSINTEDFLEFGVEIEDLKIVGSNLNRIESSAFQHVRAIKTLDLSENVIEYIDPFAFAELHSLTKLKIAHGLSDTVKIFPFEPLKAVVDLQYLDVSNNKLKNIPDTAFHFLFKLRSLNLQDNEIEHFSKGTLQGDIHKDLNSIFLSFNQLRLLGTHTFVNLRELQQIWLEDNLIEGIDQRAFSSLDNLNTIKLRGNRIIGLANEAFQNLPALKELDISFNNLDNFKFTMFDQVGSATALKVNVSYNQIVALFDSIPTSNYYQSSIYPQLPPAQMLILSESAEEMLFDQGFSTVSVNIRVLDFSHNNITFIAPYYFRHADLTLAELHLSFNKLRNITREVFGSMMMLQYLDISHNEVFHLEYDCFKKVKNLQILDLSHNYIMELPIDIFREMQSLTSVDLSHNRIKNLLDNVFPSPALELLDVSHNGLSRIPTNSLSPAASNNLVELDLSNNYIPAISSADLTLRYRNPDQNGEYWQEDPDYSDEYMYHTARRDQSRVYHQKKPYPQNTLYKSLAVLDLSDNHLVRVESGAFSSLPRLKWLDLSNNLPFNSGERSGNVFKGLERRLCHLGLKNVSLITIPSMPLPKLKSLDLSYNNLPSIPPETTANLTRLRVLDLSYNDFTTVPVATHSLTELRWLSLSGNPITALLNTSLYGVSPRMEYLDVTRLRLRMSEHGPFAKMFGLRTLKLTSYSNLRDFSIAKMISNNNGLKNLYIEVENPDTELGREMTGLLPNKLNNITITGRPLRYLAPYLFSGMQSESLKLTIFNTSIEDLPSEVFWRAGKLQNLTLDVRNNFLIKVSNPGQRGWPGVPNSIFLHDVLVAGNPLYCDCGIGWIEGWDRKRRQYLCETPSSCVTTRDDLRFATCPSYYNRTLNDVLARDLDCTWNTGFSISPNLLIIIGMTLLTFLYI